MIAEEKIENQISFSIRGAAFKTYNDLGPGLLESVYETVLQHLLTSEDHKAQSKVPLPVVYQDIKLDLGFRLDLLINDKVIIETKSVETLLPVHHKQLLTYLKLTNKKLGLLINFNEEPLKIIRIANNL
jgi:GxxExxY protein